MLTLGEGSYLLAASQTGAHGVGGIVEHENALFAADSVTTSPLSAAQRRQVWNATGITLDAKSAGAWMPTDMIQAPTLIAGQTFLYAWPVNPQFPAQMMAQALVVQSNDPATQPVVLAIASGPLTITVRDIHGQVVLAPISADFADTSGIANYVLADGWLTVDKSKRLMSASLRRRMT